ncbi:MAG: T9SS type A sorting domain-containing protein, partial [Bacteroidota bacterium]
GKGSSLCTGSLLNNTMQDSIPYFLTARHCGSGALATHFAQWIFYFNYEAPTCEDPLEDPPSMTITGCEKVAEAPDGPGSGSDFRLLRLSSKPPEDYNPWFAGWRNDGMASSSGVGIHHPMGDVKKISTYTDPLISTNYGSIVPNPAGNYWKVTWSETMSGHGVTEGGSSGSPVFDNTGKVVGTLTGGAASCSNLLEPDFYGKFSSHWDANGSANDSWLKPWLDPENSGVQSLEGFGYGSILSANFSADTTVVSIGARVMFDDLSLGEPDKWEWTFDGGDPTHYTGQHPSGITYHEYGEYDVELKIHDGDVNNDIIKKKYIRVTPNVFPNPASDYITMDFGRRQLEFIEVNIYTISGMLMREYSSSGNENGIWKIQLDGLGSGTYILHIKTNVMEDHLLLMVN